MGYTPNIGACNKMIPFSMFATDPVTGENDAKMTRQLADLRGRTVPGTLKDDTNVIRKIMASGGKPLYAFPGERTASGGKPLMSAKPVQVKTQTFEVPRETVGKYASASKDMTGWY